MQYIISNHNIYRILKIPDTVFALFYDWPVDDKLELGALVKYIESSGSVTMLGNDNKLTVNFLYQFKNTNNNIIY